MCSFKMILTDLLGSQTNLGSLAVGATLRRSHKIPPRSLSLAVLCGVWTVAAVRFAETLRTLGRERECPGAMAGNLARSLARRKKERSNRIWHFPFVPFIYFCTYRVSYCRFVDVGVNSLRKSPEPDLPRKFLRKKAPKGSWTSLYSQLSGTWIGGKL